MFSLEIKPSEKMSIFSKAIFGDLKGAAAEKEATGDSVYDLSLGSPDLPPHEKVREMLAKTSADPDMYGYTLGGISRFNKAVANYYKRRSNVSLDPTTEILQTMGSQEGLVHLPMAFCNKGDVVLTTNPAYVAYETGIKLAGAEPYAMPLRAENDFLPVFADIPDEILERTKLLILNLPGNPVPAMPTEAFFSEVVRFAKKHNIMVLHDAAYSEYFFSGSQPLSFLSVEGAKDVGLEINSLSKSFSLAGARIAYFAGNAEMIKIMQELKSNLDYGTFQPIQEAAIVALDNAEEITDHLRKVFSKRHKIVMDGMKALGWEATPSDGGMFVWAKYPYELDDVSFVFEVIDQVGVVMVPGSIFGSEGAGYVRVALVQDEAVLDGAIEQLKQLEIG